MSADMAGDYYEDDKDNSAPAAAPSPGDAPMATPPPPVDGGSETSRSALDDVDGSYAPPPANSAPTPNPTPSSGHGGDAGQPTTDALPPYTPPTDLVAAWDAVDVTGYYALIAFRGELPDNIERLGQHDGMTVISREDALSLMGEYGYLIAYIKFGEWEEGTALVTTFVG
jgi:hypothetical protein